MTSLTFEPWPLDPKIPVTLPSKQVTRSYVQLYVKYCTKTVIFHKMTSVTFELWPLDPKIPVTICLVILYPHTKLQVHRSSGMLNIVQKLIFSQNDLCDLWPLTPWPQNPIHYVSSEDIPSYQVWSQTITWFSRYQQKQNGTDGRTYVRTDIRTDDLKT